MGSFICPRCGNKNPKYIGYIGDKPYCRFCISLKGEKANEFQYSGYEVILKLDHPLSKEQKEISEHVLNNYKNGIDTLINAVCGAGKTELVYGVIEYALKRRQSVAFAVPRRDVASELFYRIKDAFPNNTITVVYGGHTSNLNADIVVLTTHQLFRYPNYFDLIILDEIDAFPYNGNDLLEIMFHISSKGRTVLMSATPNKKIIDYYKHGQREILELNTRFHRYPLPVPKIEIKPFVLKQYFIIKKLGEFLKEDKPVFIFCPTIEIAEQLFKFVKMKYKNGMCVHSKKINRPEIINDFRNGKYKFLVTTAILERGVTIKDLQVIIYQADHPLYNEYALVQISGRVGRKIDAPKGEVIFIADKATNEMEKARQTIIEKNRYL